MTREQLLAIVDQGTAAVRELCAKQRQALAGIWT